MNAHAPAFLAGAASAFIYFIVSHFELGIFFPFLPTLPIFWLGLSRRTDDALKAALIGTIILVLINGPANALVLYMLLLALPAWYIAHESLKVGTAHPIVIWFPLTVIYARLMAAGSFLLLAMTLYYSSIPGGLPGMITDHISASIAAFSKELDETSARSLALIAPSLTFFIFPVSLWIWGLCMLAHGWVTQRELVRQKIHLRPDMAIAAFPPPNWMLTLLVISVLAAIAGGSSLSFWGKSSSFILLFPYFLLGMALLHRLAKRTPYGIHLLFCLYFFMVILRWPLYAVVYHIRLLNKYLSAGGTSSRS